MAMLRRRRTSKGKRSGFAMKENTRLELWHTDWFFYNDRWIIAYLDDASRLITGYGVFDKATSEKSIKVLNESFLKNLRLT